MIARRVVASVAQRQVRHVTPVSSSAATGLVADVYDQVSEEMGLVIPPVSAQSPAPQTLAAFWTMFRESVIATGTVGRDRKEVVAAAVAVATICPYCVDMHTASIYALCGEDVAEAVAADRPDALSDPDLREIAVWAGTAHLDGRPAAPAGGELIGVLAAMHHLTRVVNVFLPGFLLPPGLSPRSRRRVKQRVGQVLRGTLAEHRAPGRSLRGIAGRTPSWAVGQPVLASAFAEAETTFEAAGERWLSPAVRRLVLDRLDGWTGKDPGLGSQWYERPMAGLSDADRAAGRLALLTALASYRVDEHVVAEFRQHLPEDRALVEVVGWTAFVSARHIAERASGNTAHEETRRSAGRYHHGEAGHPQA